ncbi:MAG: NfeD family protein [Hyphomonadaceae bacterium]|nr:NfeD family protein [Hyphomonadaceae bacterium]
MDALITFFVSLQPQHWLVLGLILLIAEMMSGTTYLLWPAAAAFIVGLLGLSGMTSWIFDVALFAVLVIALTAFGRPLVQRFRTQGGSDLLNQRAEQLIGGRAVVTAFANGVGSVKVQDTIWRATSDEALAPGETVTIAAADGVTLKVKR